jgi:hypothetical protein
VLSSNIPVLQEQTGEFLVVGHESQFDLLVLQLSHWYEQAIKMDVKIYITLTILTDSIVIISNIA